MTKDCKEVFTDIYARKVWGDGSGGGSGEQAQPYCDFVSEYLMDSGLYSVLDIGCGDLSIAHRIKWGLAHYVGVDCHAAYPPPWTEVGPRMTAVSGFDVLNHTLPAADLVLCKEVLQHLSNEQVQLLLDRTAHYPRRLFTNTMHPSLPVNTDIETGDTRAVDLTLAPFNQPAKTIFTYGHWIVQELTHA